MVRLLFPKKLRLFRSAHFTFVFQKPKRIITKKIVVFSRSNSIGNPRIGLIISKNNIKDAHERNRIKRLVRESFRIRQYILPSMDFVIIIKKETSNLNNQALLEKLEIIWRQYYHLKKKS